MAKNGKTEEPAALEILQKQYPALIGGGEVAKALEENLGGEKIAVWDLERIKIPTGGMTVWKVVGPDGEPEYPPAVEGIIVFQKMGRSFWRAGIDDGGGGMPPDCSSKDGVRGFGDPGGLCEECPMAQFGSARGKDGKKGRGQACRQQRFVFLLRPGKALPSVIALPPKSLKAMKKWLMEISEQGKMYWTFVSKFTLVEAQNADGIKYSEARVAVVRDLSAEEIVGVQGFAIKTRETFLQYREGQAEPQGDDGAEE